MFNPQCQSKMQLLGVVPFGCGIRNDLSSTRSWFLRFVLGMMNVPCHNWSNNPKMSHCFGI